VRSVVYRYDDLPRLLAALNSSRGQALPVPAGAIVRDGEWVLALFEFDSTPRATAAAGKGVLLDDGTGALVFERRDWERIRQFATARTSSAHIPAVSGERPSVPRVGQPGGSLPAASSLRSTRAWESHRPEPAPSPAIDDDARTDETVAAVMPEEPPAPQPRRLRGEGSRVLLVDDDPDLREVVAAMLEAVGLVVAAVGSAEEALEWARLDPPDLVVLDWNLPGMSGLDLCKVMRADPQLRHLPLLFLTAHSATQDMVAAFAAGADDYVVKPFRAAELGARIFGLLRRTRAIAAPSP
jgi:two-component system phosphate regulon response regulator PhoB